MSTIPTYIRMVSGHTPIDGLALAKLFAETAPEEFERTDMGTGIPVLFIPNGLKDREAALQKLRAHADHCRSALYAELHVDKIRPYADHLWSHVLESAESLRGRLAYLQRVSEDSEDFIIEGATHQALRAYRAYGMVVEVYRQQFALFQHRLPMNPVPVITLPEGFLPKVEAYFADLGEPLPTL